MCSLFSVCGNKSPRSFRLPFAGCILAGLWVILFMGGCAVRHPRDSAEMTTALAEKPEVAILMPDIRDEVKYIGSEVYYEANQFEAPFAESLRLALIKHGIEARVVESSEETKAVAAKIKEASESIIVRDLAYDIKTLDEMELEAWKGTLPLVPATAGKSRTLVLYVSGWTMRETDEEFYDRWMENLTLNLATLPITLASTLLPFTAPLSVEISTDLFKASPDKSYLVLSIFDNATGKPVYMNDIYTTDFPEDAEDMIDMVETLLEDFELPEEAAPTPIAQKGTRTGAKPKKSQRNR